jgi:hypothetical protein
LLPAKPTDAKIENHAAATESVHARGHLGGALRFDGSVYATAEFPGVFENAPHTIVFWVRVPKDASLSNAYAMVGRLVNSKALGSHPIHIAWNRKAEEGTLGVLRTDYGKGFAIGETPLRDGRWHHIAVVFVPRDDSESPVEVKQYVDGRLEGEGHPSAPGSNIFNYSPARSAQSTSGTIWLGTRLGTDDVRGERFRGEIDELFIADRALEQQEIVRLMSNNRLDQ